MKNKLFFDYITLEKGLSKNTVSAYKRDINEFLSYFNSIFVTTEDIRNYFSKLDCSSSSKRRKISSLRSFYTFLKANNHIDFYPFESIKSVKAPKKIPDYLTIREVNSIRESFLNNALGVRDKLIFNILIYTGARVSEALSLSVSDIDHIRGTIRFVGKGNRVRFVPLSDVLEKDIKDYIDNYRQLFIKNGRTEKVFINISRNNYWYRLKKAAKMANIKDRIYPHILRHTFATFMLSNGANIRHVQEMLGHSNISTTEIYTHISKDKLKSIYDEIDLMEEK
jgi:integrase/recombinase XerD